MLPLAAGVSSTLECAEHKPSWVSERVSEWVQGLRWDRRGRAGLRAHRDGRWRCCWGSRGSIHTADKCLNTSVPQRDSTRVELRPWAATQQPGLRPTEAGHRRDVYPAASLENSDTPKKFAGRLTPPYPSTTFHRLVVQQSSAVALTTGFRRQTFFFFFRFPFFFFSWNIVTGNYMYLCPIVKPTIVRALLYLRVSFHSVISLKFHVDLFLCTSRLLYKLTRLRHKQDSCFHDTTKCTSVYFLVVVFFATSSLQIKRDENIYLPLKNWISVSFNHTCRKKTANNKLVQVHLKSLYPEKLWCPIFFFKLKIIIIVLHTLNRVPIAQHVW